MFEPNESKRKQGRVTVLALLFGLLLGFSGGGTASKFDSNQARLGNGGIVRTAAGLRIGSRSGEDRPDTEDTPALLSPAPRIVTELVSIRPAAPAVETAAPVPSLDARFHYQARAPPAA